MVRFNLKPLLQGQTRIAIFKSAYNSLLIGARGLQCENNIRKSWARNLLMWSHLTLGPMFVKIVGTFPGLNFPGIFIHFNLFILRLKGETTFLNL